MDLIDQIKAFVATAQTGSFTAAADQIGISNRLTSKYVAELETRLGVRLFQRTTRKVGLTPAGDALLARAPALLDDLDALLSSLADGSQALTGVIRMSAPVTFGEIYVAPMLGRFADQHPDLTFDLRLSDQYSDLASDGIDVAFRLGTSETQSLKVRKLGEFQSVALASPDYISRCGPVADLADLERHACIVDTNRRSKDHWRFYQNGAPTTVTAKGRFHVNSARAALDLAAAGMGITYSPRFAAIDYIASGALVPVLTDYDTETAPITAVYLEGRALPRKIRALIEFAASDIRQSGIV